LELQSRIPATAAWIEHAPPLADLRVSVITATHNRRSQLNGALVSVQAQSHSNWEHVIVDDGSTDGTAEFIAGVAHDRLNVVQTAHSGLGAARNAGLAAATGSIITYLDDDNRMHPHWLRSVVWAFSRLPDLDFLYGARIIEDYSAKGGRPSGEMPRLELIPYDRSLHERVNIIDANVMAHRAHIPGGHFAEDLGGVEDWDLGLRLARGRTPLALPAIACFYSTLNEGRMCDTEALDDGRRLLSSRMQDGLEEPS